MVCSPWMEDILQGKGVYLPKVIIFSFEDKEPLWIFTTGMHGMRIYVLCQESTNSINSPSRQMSQRTPSTTGRGHTTRHKKCKKRCKKLKKNGEWIKLYICRRSSYVSVLLKFLMFHSIARETTNQATTQIQSPTWQVYTLFPLWVGNLLPQGTEIGIQIW